MNESLLNTINSIDEAIMESEMNVIISLEQEYSKINMLSKYTSPNSVSCIMESDTSSNKNVTIPKKALRLLINLFKSIKNESNIVFNKLTNDRSIKDMKSVKGTPSQALSNIKGTRPKIINKDNVDDFFKLYIKDDGEVAFIYDIKQSLKILSRGVRRNLPKGKQYLKDTIHDTRPNLGHAEDNIFLLYFFIKEFKAINKIIFRLMDLMNKYSILSKEQSYINDVNILNNDFKQVIINEQYKYAHDKLIFSAGDIKLISTGMTQCLNEIPSMDKLPDQDNTIAYVQLMQMYNDSINFFSALQLALNVIYKEIKVDMDLADSDKDSCNIYELDRFIEELMKMNYPEKYIHTLVYQAARPELKNGFTKAKWGQFRGCLIPKNENVVYKYALCKKGTRDNENEYGIYKKFESNNLMTIKYLCKPIEYTQLHNIIAMEKVRFSKLKSIGLPKKLLNKIDEEVKSKRVNITIGDIHADNVGFRTDGSPIITDYGSSTVGPPERNVINLLQI